MTAQDIVIKPIISEKSIGGLQENKYTFKVAKDANKLKSSSALRPQALTP